MQYITNSKFINTYLKDYKDIDEIIYYFDVIKSLLKKYWLKIASEWFISKISSVDSNLSDFILMLNVVWKLSLKSVIELERLIKNIRLDYKKTFSALWKNVSKSEWDLINSVSKKVSNSKVIVNDSEEIGLQVTWEWMYYKRFLNDDLSKLLK